MSKQFQIYHFENPKGETIEIEAPSQEAALIAYKRQIERPAALDMDPPKTSGQRGSPPVRDVNAEPYQPKPFLTVEDFKRFGKTTAIGAAGIAGGEFMAPLLLPFISKIPGLAGATSEMLSGPLSSISMATLENMLSGKMDPNEIAKTALVNEGVGKGVSGIYQAPKAISRAVQEYKKPGSIVDKYLQKLGGTFSQYTGSNVAKFIEDTFAPGSKRAAVQTSENRGRQLIESQINPATLDDYRQMAGIARTEEASNYYASGAASTAKGNLVQAIAQSNPKPIYKQVKSPIMGPNNQPVVSTILDKTIEGPTPLSKAIINAKAIVDEIAVNPDKDALLHIIADKKYNTLQNTAAKILAETNAAFDKAGTLISHDPVSFKNAWQFQKDIGNFSAAAYDTNQINFNKSQLNELYSSLGDDITDGTKLWPKNGTQATSLFNESKALVKERQSAFFPETGKQLGKVVLPKGVNTSDAWNEIINDNHALSKVIINPKMPVAAQAGIPIANPRKELANFKLGDMWNKAKTTDAQGKSSFNTAAFFKQFNAPEFAQSESKVLPSSKDLLYSKGTQEDIRRLGTALGKIEPANAPSKYIYLKSGASSIVLGAGIATTLSGGKLPSSTLGAGAIAGVALTGVALGKLMTNKNTARLMVAMAEGQPLGMPERFAARLIGNVLKGETVNFVYGDNNEVEAKLDTNGASIQVK